MASKGASSANPGAWPTLEEHNSSVSEVPVGRVSCLTCRRRKIKCDKLSPCSHCVRSHSHCDYAPRKRAPKRSKKNADNGREAELLSRLNKLEGTVKELSGQLDAPPAAQIQQPASNHVSNVESTTSKSLFGRAIAGQAVPAGAGGTRIEESFGTLVLSDGGTTRYLNNYWARLTEEVDDIRNLMIEESSGDDSPSPAATSELTENDAQSFVFGYASSNVKLRSLHPLPSQLQYYLKVFTKNVDTLYKILHIPSMEGLMREAEDSFESLTSAKEALLFAIYFAVIASSSPEEVKSNFGLDRKVLLENYCFGVEQALARADFLNTSELITLQAFVIYLACARSLEDPRAGWTLTRSAIRVAQSQGLHRDGTQLGLSPFETEMRRRLWWQLCILEFRDSERNGTDASVVQGSFDTKMPLNINDSDLTQDAMQFPEPRQGLTEMTHSLLTCDVCATLLALSFSRPRLGSAPLPESTVSVPEMEKIIHDFQSMLPEKYLKYCTDDSPTAYITANMCNLIFYKMQLMAFLPFAQSKPRESIPKETSDRMWIASIKTVEYRRNLEVESTKHWHWYLRMFVQWHAIAYLLRELCERDPDENTSYAWRVLDSVFQNWVEKQKHGAPEVLWAPMRKLIAMARRKRKLDLLTTAQNNVPDENAELGESYPAFSIPVDLEPINDADSPAAYQENWLQQPQNDPNSYDTPWLLEEGAMLDLGIDMRGLDGEMEWEGVNDWIQELRVEGNANRNPRNTW
ncbi:fungal-specific transcription factor domain-containing protein [Leptodontidium sp. MPI-SDFR-AT-0119]|nr:fungal-specific transcription factor domain-containing protein [Leptodontidium sp. MPI-SDFR-AT-0119]